jgi:hypothetical protein
VAGVEDTEGAEREPATEVAAPDEAATEAAEPAAEVAASDEPPIEPAERPARRPPPEPAPLAPPTATFQALLVVAAAALSGFTILRAYGPHDEGLMLAWADRIVHGQWPYRDFWCNYGPGQPILLAGLQKLFGPSFLAWRVLRVAIDAFTALAAYRLVRRDAGEAWALAAWLAVAGAMAFPTGPGPTAPALLLAFAALLAGRRAPGRGGALAGLAFVFRPEIGVAAALGVVLERRSARPLAPAALVAVLCLAPFAVVAPGDMAGQILRFASVQGLQRLPLVPSLAVGGDANKLLELLFPLLLVLATAVWIAWAAWRRPEIPALALAPLIAVGVAYLLGRTDEFHVLPLSAVLAVALALGAAREPVTAAKSALAIALAVIAVHGLDRRAGELRHPPRLAAIPGTVADGVRTSPADAGALRRVLRTVRRRARPGRPVLVAPARFERVRVGDPLLNVLLRRPNPTRYDVMQPGVVTTAKAQREMRRDLIRSRAPVVIRWLAPTARLREPNGSARSSGVHLLDRTIAARYRRLVRYGDYLILVRRRELVGPHANTYAARWPLISAWRCPRPLEMPGGIPSGPTASPSVPRPCQAAPATT